MTSRPSMGEVLGLATCAVLAALVAVAFAALGWGVGGTVRTALPRFLAGFGSELEAAFVVIGYVAGAGVGCWLGLGVFGCRGAARTAAAASAILLAVGAVVIAGGRLYASYSGDVVSEGPFSGVETWLVPGVAVVLARGLFHICRRGVNAPRTESLSVSHEEG